MQLFPPSSPSAHALTTGTIWQAEAIMKLAAQLLKQRNSSEARVASARGIIECAKAIEKHELSRQSGPKE